MNVQTASNDFFVDASADASRKAVRVRSPERTLNRWYNVFERQPTAVGDAEFLTDVLPRELIFSSNNAAALYERLSGDRLDASDDKQAIESVLKTDVIERACARFRAFESFGEDWDGEGATAPKKELIQIAVSFLRKLQPWHPRPLSAVDSDGNPVIEFHDGETDFFGKIRFTSSDCVEMFVVLGDATPGFWEGALTSEEAARFLSDEFQITLRP